MNKLQCPSELQQKYAQTVCPVPKEQIIISIPARSHASEYLILHPPEQSDDVFYWTWEFHNAVSSRIGKPEMSYETAAHMYLTSA